MKKIPIIDVFAGPGGLGEGFSALKDSEQTPPFKIVLSIEKEFYAHQTLTLRSFYRQFEQNAVPKEYYAFLKGEITREDLYNRWPVEAERAKEEAWCATLGDESKTSNAEVDRKIDNALEGEKNWLLIGGPPCQAYSIVGRARRQETVLNEEDEKVGLYKQYLRILAVHNPAVFVMENVKGLLSAKTKESPIFSRILKDLSDPLTVYLSDYKKNGRQLTCPGYKIYSLVVPAQGYTENEEPIFRQKDYLIHAEKYGIPQTRHRIILLGIRKGINIIPDIISPEEEVSVADVLCGLPPLRSGLSKSQDSYENWKNVISGILNNEILDYVDKSVKKEIKNNFKNIKRFDHETGAEYINYEGVNINYEKRWFIDNKLAGVCNHSARGHMDDDIMRYFFISCHGASLSYSPQLNDFPPKLLPNHRNVYRKNGSITKKFADRFRVQIENKPSKTITSHISQDGHYFIHPDALQCRSFTVREAARIQTFPDNYYFCGPRTAQFIQVGNAVPPLLAYKISGIVCDIFYEINRHEKTLTKKKRYNARVADI